jgi:hypothetical protein
MTRMEQIQEVLTGVFFGAFLMVLIFSASISDTLDTILK